ncbi:MAG TPA: hypothetical protein VFR07_13150 [Mycobacteriales bacterium]|jgi:hypothetical protein|nr:hypothetical protein [Mycobacteriales bacterium]
MSGWHVTPESAAAYAADRLDEVEAWSTEAHVERCGACASLVSAAADPAILADVRARVLERTRSPARGFVRLTVTPAMGLAWLAAVAGVIVGVLLLDVLDATRLPAVLLVAPLLPLLGLALGCAPGVDASAELLASTPVSTLRVLLLRAAAVLLISVPPLLVVSLLTSAGPFLWLAPSAGLVALALALTTRLRVEVATGAAAGVWALLALGPAALQEAPPPALAPGAPAAWAALAAVCVALLVVRREHLDRVGVPR